MERKRPPRSPRNQPAQSARRPWPERQLDQPVPTPEEHVAMVERLAREYSRRGLEVALDGLPRMDYLRAVKARRGRPEDGDAEGDGIPLEEALAALTKDVPGGSPTAWR